MFKREKYYAVKAIDADSYQASWVQLRKDATVKTKDFDLVFSKELASPFPKKEAKWLAHELDMANTALLKPRYYFEISRIR